MRHLTLMGLLLATLLLVARPAQTLPAVAAWSPQYRPAGSYAVDSGHSGVIFRIKHMGVSNFWGRFNQVEGAFELSDDPRECTVEITIDAASVDTNSEGRDKHVKGPDFFNVKEYPRITFASKRVSVDGDSYSIVGDLTLVGKTQEVTLLMTKIGEAKTRMGVKCGFEGEFTLDRKAFGMSALEGGLGTDIKCILFIEGAKED